MSYLAIFAMLKAVLFFFTLACLICFFVSYAGYFLPNKTKNCYSLGFSPRAAAVTILHPHRG